MKQEVDYGQAKQYWCLFSLTTLKEQLQTGGIALMTQESSKFRPGKSFLYPIATL